jgi:hypothetical protein
MEDILLTLMEDILLTLMEDILLTLMEDILLTLMEDFIVHPISGDGVTNTIVATKAGVRGVDRLRSLGSGARIVESGSARLLPRLP